MSCNFVDLLPVAVALLALVLLWRGYRDMKFAPSVILLDTPGVDCKLLSSPSDDDLLELELNASLLVRM
jgi:hypothetical protein